MKKTASLAALIVALPISTAFAADLPSRKDPVVAPVAVPMWTGFYAGLNAGYNWGTNANAYSQNWGLPLSGLNVQGTAVGTEGVPAAPIAMDGVAANTQSGFIGGAQFGYNYQMGSFLIGAETDIQGTNTRGSGRTSGAVADNTPVTLDGVPSSEVTANGTTLGATAVQGGVDYLGTVRGRVGYLWSPALMVYGTGGFAYGGAWANVGQTAVSSGQLLGPAGPIVAGSSMYVGGGRQNQLLTGWTAGAGAEWMFMPNWSLKGEALYWDLGRMNINTVSYLSTGGGLAWGRTNVNYSGVMARAGINYHFNFSAAPVVAKY